MQSKLKKNDAKYNISNKKKQEKAFNEISIKRRTIENNTHESFEDLKLKRITTWRKSRAKFFNNLKYNILTFGILHLISLYKPYLYIKLYCNPWPAKECDFFLVENIYGQCTLCVKIHKKGNINETNYNPDATKEKVLSSLNNINLKSEYNIIKTLTYSFIYKSVTYEYNEETNEIIPVYINLSNMTNKGILNFFGEGLKSENLVNKFKERYGKNEYNINIKLPFLYFKKSEIPSFFFVLIIGIFELIILGDYVSLFIKSFIILIIFLIQYLYLKQEILNKYKDEYSLDGEKSKLKVNRKYLIKDNNKSYVEINNADLLPGDIIYLKSNDFVPCDCILIEGECFVNESNLTGCLNIYKKISLENNNEQFNYLFNNINILFHGMKIIKAFSKLNNGFISALCLNTGSNTYKANQYSNILYFLERNKKYNNAYNFFGSRKIAIFTYMILVFILSILFGCFYLFRFKLTLNKAKFSLFLYKIIIRNLSKSLMAVYFIAHHIIIILNISRLKNENIICFDKSRLLNSGNINTIFFNKTGTLCSDNFEINGFHPVILNSQRPGCISFKNFSYNQCKEMNIQLLKYYKEYLYKQNYNYNYPDNNLRFLKILPNQLIYKDNNKSYQYISLFLECLLCCNNLEKYNIELFGNNIEINLFNEFNWNIEINDNYISDIKNNSCEEFFFNLIEKRIIDIFPNNYYKITESLNYKNDNCQKKKINKNNNQGNIIEKNNIYLSHKNKLKKDSSFNINEITKNINNSKINSYKLRVFKKFIKNGTLNSGAIVFNFITNELRFMIKGMPEDILEKCDKNTFPDNLENAISYYRRKGFIIIVCASKIINIEEYKDSNDFDYYMNDLAFCGFITINNITKENIKQSIQELKQFNYNLIITSGDNEYNCLSLGFKCGIIENKNIYSFDIDDYANKLILKKIYNSKVNNFEDIKANISIEKNSKSTSKKSYNKTSFNLNSFKDNFAKLDITAIPQYKNSFWKKDINEKKKSKLLNEISERENFNNSINFNISDYKEKDSNANYNEIIIPNTIKNHFNKTNVNRIERKKINKNKEKTEENSFKRNKSFISNGLIKHKNIFCYEKFYYYPRIFKDYDELKDNCIFCISGKAFNFLYKNKEKKEWKYLLKKICKKCIIFFNMSSIDKSFLIDYYRENPNNYICNIGECENDIDSLISSNVGINLKKPNNQNTILFHFYSPKKSIDCITKIIMEGRIFYENAILLEFSSFLCTMALNSFILCCFFRNIDVLQGQLNFLEIEFLVLSIIAFTGESRNKIVVQPLAKNKKLLKIYYLINLIGILLMKLLSLFIFSILYKSDFQLSIEKRDNIFVTYYFILCIEFIICIVYSFNFISFYRKSPFSNTFLKFITLLIVSYILILVALNSSNFRYDFLKLTVFEFSQNLIDSFADRNRTWLILLCLFDFISSIIFITIIYFIFNKIAKIKLINNKDIYSK